MADGYMCVLNICCLHKGYPKIVHVTTKFQSEEHFLRSKETGFKDIRERLVAVAAAQLGDATELLVVEVYDKPFVVLEI